MEQNKMMTPEQEDKFNKYFRRIKEEVQKINQKGWDPKRCAKSASMLLAQFGWTKDPECAEEAATYILAATYALRGDK